MPFAFVVVFDIARHDTIESLGFHTIAMKGSLVFIYSNETIPGN